MSSRLASETADAVRREETCQVHAVRNIQLLSRPPLELVPAVGECHHHRVCLGPAGASLS